LLVTHVLMVILYIIITTKEDAVVVPILGVHSGVNVIHHGIRKIAMLKYFTPLLSIFIITAANIHSIELTTQEAKL
jgi:hypothetical protein